MSTVRPFLIYGVALIVVFVVSIALGYGYQYDPERDLIEVVVDRSGLPDGDGDFANGTVVDVRDGSVLVGTALGTIEVLLDGVTIEELRPLDDPERFPEGVAVNLGGERTPTERVISGVVLIGSEAAP